MEEIKGIASKIVKVMEGIESVSKDGFNAFHKYKYVTDAAIVSEIRKSLIINKVVVIPNQISCVQTGDLTTLCVEYTLIDSDSGEFLKTQVYGYGKDSGDKGPYKAATGAEKYFLMKTFLLATDDDPENESKETTQTKGTNTGVRVPAGYWKMRENDPQGAQELLGGDTYFPGKTDKGYFVFTNEKPEETEKFVKTIGKPPSEPEKTAPEPLISHDERLELVRLLKEKKVPQTAFLAYLNETFGIPGTAKIKSKDYNTIYGWIITNEVTK